MKAQELIHSAQLTRGACRESILEALLESNTALSEQEIKTKLKDRYDRTSIYRTFKTLVESGLLHQINIEKGLVKYAINANHNNAIQHVHFYCSDCGKVLCMKQSMPDTILLDKNYHIQSAELILKGTCPECNVKL